MMTGFRPPAVNLDTPKLPTLEDGNTHWLWHIDSNVHTKVFNKRRQVFCVSSRTHTSAPVVRVIINLLFSWKSQSVFKEGAWQKRTLLPKSILLNQELQFGLIQTHNIRKRGEKKQNSPLKLNGGERTSCCCNEDLSFTVPAVNHKLPTRVSAHRAFKYTETKRPCLSCP